jgi:hypothetical protein
MLTFHPQGIHHGPQPGAVARAADKTRTDEVAVMIDTRRPLDADRAAPGRRATPTTGRAGRSPTEVMTADALHRRPTPSASLRHRVRRARRPRPRRAAPRCLATSASRARCGTRRRAVDLWRAARHPLPREPRARLVRRALRRGPRPVRSADGLARWTTPPRRSRPRSRGARARPTGDLARRRRGAAGDLRHRREPLYFVDGTVHCGRPAGTRDGLRAARPRARSCRRQGLPSPSTTSRTTSPRARWQRWADFYKDVFGFTEVRTSTSAASRPA